MMSHRLSLPWIWRGCVILFAVTVATPVRSEPWPTYRHDARRSGVTQESLSFPLHKRWTRLSQQPPQMAWTGPAKWDAWAGNRDLQSMRNFDPCFFVTVSQGRVFFGSSVDDAVHALDAETGREQWVHFTGSAVRFPPTLDQGRAYFASDDGWVYCCEQSSGSLIWKRQAAPRNDRITSNRKLISLWPVRTGVLIQDDRAIFGASLVPWNPSYLSKVNARTGEPDAEDCFVTEVAGVTLQGALLASEERIYVPQGRAAPLAFDIKLGKSLGPIGEAGGVFCILTEDEMLLAGPQNQKSSENQLRVADAIGRQRLATFSGTNRILVDGHRAWLPIGDHLKSLDRSAYIDAQVASMAAKKVLGDKSITDERTRMEAQAALDAATERSRVAWKWEVECPPPSGFVKAGNAILVGLENEVRAYDSETGNLLWREAVEGTVHGLAVAGGRLFVSTGLGHLYAFQSP